MFVGAFPAAGGNAKVLGAGTNAAKALGKAAYVFSADAATGKVAHVNFVPKDVLDRKALDAKAWLAVVSAVLGGKGGGKPETATGVGLDAAKLPQALDAARKAYADKVGA